MVNYLGWATTQSLIVLRVTQPSWKINLEKVGIMNRRTYLMGNFYAIHDMEECSRQVFTIVVARYSEETD